MYETHFGLKRRPFRALALGNDVFIGPQSAATLAGVTNDDADNTGLLGTTTVVNASPLTVSDDVIGDGTVTLTALDGVGAGHHGFDHVHRAVRAAGGAERHVGADPWRNRGRQGTGGSCHSR